LILQSENIGFGAACNQGIKKALKNPKCNYVFLINNDTVLHSQVLTKIMDIVRTHQEAGIFGPKIYYAAEKNKVWYAGARRRRLVLAAADTGRGLIDQGQFDKIREVDYVFGTAMLIRRRVFKQIGLFDESFFLYLEDLDFCLRAQQIGIQLMFVPCAKVWHRVSASTTHNEALRRYHIVRSTVIFLEKHISLYMLAPTFIFWLLVTLRTIVFDLLQGKFPVIRSHCSGLARGIAETLQKG
jgi:GT2 family glycosyltransferase